MPGNSAGLVTVGNKGGKAVWTTSSANAWSGPTMLEARGWKNWMFSCIGGASATTITVYGTIDPAVYLSDGMTPNVSYPAPGAAGGYWFALNSGAQATAPASVVNPFTKADGTQYMIFSGNLVAVSFQSGATQTGTSTILAYAAP